MKLPEIITYFDLFDYPLKKEEVLLFTEVAETEWNTPGLQEQDGYIFLAGREKIIRIRKKRELHAEKLWKKVGRYNHFFRLIPFVKMIGVCNTLAFNHPDKDSDIDLFIVTNKSRLWTARILTTVLLQFLGVRRHGKKVAGRFCLSFWCTQNAMDLEKIQIKPSDPYLAFWILTLQPILDNGTFANFIQTNNKWIRKTYKLKPSLQNPPPAHSNILARLLEMFLIGKIGDFFENRLKQLFKPRAQRKAKKAGKQASIIISDQMLKFHNHDKRKSVLQKWRSNLKQNHIDKTNLKIKIASKK